MINNEMYHILKNKNSIRLMVDSGTISKEELGEAVYRYGDQIQIEKLSEQNRLLSDIVEFLALAARNGLQDTDDKSDRTSEITDYDEIYTKIISYAKNKGEISTDSIMKQFNMSYKRAKGYMERMENEGVAKKMGKNKPHTVISQY